MMFSFISERAVKAVISLTYTCLAVVYRSSADSEFGTNFGQQAEVHRTVNVGTLDSKLAEVNGTKTKSLRYRRAKYLIDSKRAGQGNNPYSALKFFL